MYIFKNYFYLYFNLFFKSIQNFLYKYLFLDIGNTFI